MYESPSKAKELTAEEIEAWNMWIYKQHGIMPNQYHYFYDQNETLLYQEHIEDLLTIDKMWINKQEYQRKKAEAAQKAKEKNPFNKGKGFYGQTYKYK
jgi:hypothetical protein